MGNCKPGSDVDLVLKGTAVSEMVAWDISVELNERSQLPYKFDILAYSSLENLALKEDIDRYGQLLFRRKSWVIYIRPEALSLKSSKFEAAGRINR